jgi:hypothetical protein
VKHQTCESAQPWVIYTYPRTDEESDRMGEALVIMQCAVCGDKAEWRAPLPTAEECALIPPDHKPQARIDFLTTHNHRPLPHALTWALPLLNVGAHNETMDVLEAVARSAAQERP